MLSDNNFFDPERPMVDQLTENEIRLVQTILNQTTNRQPNSDYLTREQAARYLNVKKSTLESWAVRGGGPPMRKVGTRAVRYHRQDLDKFASRRILKNTSQTCQA